MSDQASSGWVAGSPPAETIIQSPYGMRLTVNNVDSSARYALMLPQAKKGDMLVPSRLLHSYLPGVHLRARSYALMRSTCCICCTPCVWYEEKLL